MRTTLPFFEDAIMTQCHFSKLMCDLKKQICKNPDQHVPHVTGGSREWWPIKMFQHWSTNNAQLFLCADCVFLSNVVQSIRSLFVTWSCCLFCFCFFQSYTHIITDITEVNLFAFVYRLFQWRFLSYRYLHEFESVNDKHSSGVNPPICKMVWRWWAKIKIFFFVLFNKISLQEFVVRINSSA